MTPTEYLERKALLAGFEAIKRNRAYVAELLPLFQQNFKEAITGLRNRKRSLQERNEYLQAADDAERLVAFVDKRIEQLTEELKIPPGDLDGAEE